MGKKGKIDVYILLRESSCRRLLAAAANLLVLVTLLVDGEILARGGRGESAGGTRGASERERNPNLLMREKSGSRGTRAVRESRSQKQPEEPGPSRSEK